MDRGQTSGTTGPKITASETVRSSAAYSAPSCECGGSCARSRPSWRHASSPPTSRLMRMSGRITLTSSGRTALAAQMKNAFSNELPLPAQPSTPVDEIMSTSSDWLITYASPSVPSTERSTSERVERRSDAARRGEMNLRSPLMPVTTIAAATVTPVSACASTTEPVDALPSRCCASAFACVSIVNRIAKLALMSSALASSTNAERRTRLHRVTSRFSQKTSEGSGEPPTRTRCPPMRGTASKMRPRRHGTESTTLTYHGGSSLRRHASRCRAYSKTTNAVPVGDFACCSARSSAPSICTRELRSARRSASHSEAPSASASAPRSTIVCVSRSSCTRTRANCSHVYATSSCAMGPPLTSAKK
mmetsp:Transcript_15156/g.39393  ORF Transcript_15156/g.39393 Transcript_15156/m.39393 type:complete len:362 (+) Transcript_15156:806-1891(+)